jgi:L-lysine 2,3-aminomutase
MLVLHINHPAEIGNGLVEACQQLISAGVTLLNQSVLLRGVNDDSQILCTLSERLFHNNVIPYYLHQLDRVHGAAHFEVNEQDAQRLLNEMRQRLPGYLIPRLVQELSGAPHKTPL